MENKLQNFDLVISFDDTGSMSSVRREVRRRITNLTDDLFKIIPNLRVGIIIHNDYCDRDLVQKLDLTSNFELIESFINRNSSQGGGDAKEAYAYVLNQFKTFDWQAENKCCILIGDERPHEKGEKSAGVVELFDWKQESKDLKAMGIPVYGIQALHNRNASFFYEGLSQFSGGIKLDLSQFSHINDYILAITHHENGTLDDFQNTQKEYSSNLSLRNMFSKLRGKVDVELEKEILEKGELLSKFQVLNVYGKTKIKQFVEETGVHYKAGKGYYQLINKELIQANKEVIFVDKITGETIFDTKWCREQMGLPFGIKGNINPKYLDCAKKYDIFVQSNSYTRDLDSGTKFLYELNRS